MQILLLSCVVVITAVWGDDPTITLIHGGRLRGRRTELNGQIVDQFYGIRYAKAPVADLRFRKPQDAEPWEGLRNATRAGNICVQYSAVSETILGDEDCLYLDITIPGGIAKTSDKAVMVWFHGGGYATGAGSIYIGAPLALRGDVLVVTINYRLGVFGFLSDENMGTGNYGLWDQRAAILWVKGNIAAFGGNPEMITIFGESAGASSVVAQMMSVHNDGLFQRAIAESGTLYQPWSWYMSLKRRADLAGEIKATAGCGDHITVFDCLRNIDVPTVLNRTWPYSSGSTFHPVPDNDFFPADIVNDTYRLTNRFDLLIGYNENEVGLMSMPILQLYASALNESVENGISANASNNYLEDVCRTNYLVGDPTLCVQVIEIIYNGPSNLTSSTQNFHILVKQMKHSWFDTDTTYLLTSRQDFQKATYAYQFEKFIPTPVEVPYVAPPAWVNPKADHTDELFYVFGFDQYNENISKPVNHTLEELADDFIVKYKIGLQGKKYATENDTLFSEKIQTFWTNFAKSGNPNTPAAVDSPIWPEFKQDSQFMCLSDDMNSTRAPDLYTHQMIILYLYPARRQKIANNDTQPILPSITSPTASTTTTNGDAVQTSPAVRMAGMATVIIVATIFT